MDYIRGLDALKAQLEQTNRFEEFTIFEARLLENLNKQRLFGDDETKRAARNEIVANLNNLSRDALGISFNDLAMGRTPQAGERSLRDLQVAGQLNVTPTPNDLEPPVILRLQDLPLNKLPWDQFEALCVALVEAQPATINCSLYGVQGDVQQGIDIVAHQRGKDGEEKWAYQCKRYQDFTPGQLQEAFAKMSYQANYYVLMLSIPATAALRKVADDSPNKFLWDGKDISRKLKNYPAIVEDFFGPAWRQAFCG